jgi:hypothetical protein
MNALKIFCGIYPGVFITLILTNVALNAARMSNSIKALKPNNPPV